MEWGELKVEEDKRTLVAREFGPIHRREKARRGKGLLGQEEKAHFLRDLEVVVALVE